MITLPATRTLYLAGFLLCTALIITALYFQHGLGMEPCPLCILQRIAVFAVGVVLLVAAVLNPVAIGRRLVGILVICSAAAGGAVSARHVWLQHLPKDLVPACGPDLDYMLEVFSFSETLDMVLKGSGECAKVSWSLVGLSMPEWMLVIFSAFALFGLWITFSKRL